MGFQLAQIVNKVLRTDTKIESSDIAVPVDLQYHTIDNPLPMTIEKTALHETVVTNVLVPAGTRYESGYINAVGNSVDFGIRLVGTGGTCKIIYAPYPNEYNVQIGSETVWVEATGASFRSMEPARVTSPRFKVLVDNTGSTDFSIQVLSITQHLGSY